MSAKEILNNIKQLPFDQRLYVIEKALKTLYDSSNSELEKAAKALVHDYKNDKDLISFTELDFEKFYEA